MREDLEGVAELLAPLEQKGILKPRSREQLKAELPHFTVIDLEVLRLWRLSIGLWLCFLR